MCQFSRAGPSPTQTKRALGRICCRRRKAFTARPRFFPRRCGRHGSRPGHCRPRPILAQPRVAPARIELLAVDRTCQQAYTFETLFAEELLQFAGGYQRCVGLVVEPAHPAHRSGLQPGDAVVGQVLVEAGVETTGDRNAKAARGAQRRPAQRAFGDDRIGTLLLPVAVEPDRCRQAEAQAGVARQCGTRNQQRAWRRVQRFAGLAWRIRSMSWPEVRSPAPGPAR